MSKIDKLYPTEDLILDVFPNKQKFLDSLKKAYVKIRGGDGKTPETAVRFLGNINDFQGFVLQNMWLLRHCFGDREIIHQTLLKDGKEFSKFTMQKKDGREYAIYFDITDSFGKI